MMGFTFGKSTILAEDFKKLFLVKRHPFTAPLSTLDELVTKCAPVSTLTVMEKGKGTHMSMFFVVMRGEYDALLPWPFVQKVHFKKKF